MHIMFNGKEEKKGFYKIMGQFLNFLDMSMIFESSILYDMIL